MSLQGFDFFFFSLLVWFPKYLISFSRKRYFSISSLLHWASLPTRRHSFQTLFFSAPGRLFPSKPCGYLFIFSVFISRLKVFACSLYLPVETGFFCCENNKKIFHIFWLVPVFLGTVFWNGIFNLLEKHKLFDIKSSVKF